MIRTFGNGGWVATGEDVKIVRLLALKNALALELKGIKLSRGKSAASIIKREFGLKGNNEKVYNQFVALLKEKGVLRD